jgi:DNA-binding transcriptional regulator YiaG
MALAPVHYCATFDHDGKKYKIDIPHLVIPKCSNCGEISLDDYANKLIDRAFRAEAGLLAPEQILKNLKDLGLSQREFAARLKISEATLSRWVTGAQIQQRSLDQMMRIFFAYPEVRQALMDETRLSQIGSTVGQFQG